MTIQQQQLVEDNIKLVYYTISHYYSWLIGNEDIEQEGMIGLCKAAKSYEPEKGAFSTYAVVKIRGAISDELSRDRKRIKTVSLDAERELNDDDVTLYNSVIGDENEGYVDLRPLYKVLNPRQREIFDLVQRGMSRSDICEVLGVSKQAVHHHIRLIRKKWEKVMKE